VGWLNAYCVHVCDVTNHTNIDANGNYLEVIKTHMLTTMPPLLYKIKPSFTQYFCSESVDEWPSSYPDSILYMGWRASSPDS